MQAQRADATARATTRHSFLTHLECTACGATYGADELHTVCPACGKVLYARYDLAGAAAAMTREALAARPFTLWRYHEVLPVRDIIRQLVSQADETLKRAPALVETTRAAKDKA